MFSGSLSCSGPSPYAHDSHSKPPSVSFSSNGSKAQRTPQHSPTTGLTGPSSTQPALTTTTS